MTSFRALLVAFLIIPLLELYLLIRIGSWFGILPTLLALMITAVGGVILLKIQGLSTWQRLQDSIARGDVPALEMLEGSMLLIASVLLLAPGFLTDILGLLCLVPPIRRQLARYLLLNWFSINVRIESATRLASAHKPRVIQGDIDNNKKNRR